jgi:hypothetical protein
MSVSVRVAIAALFAVGALASCVRSPDSVRPETQASGVTSTEPELVVPQEYYGRTEFEIPGGDGQVIDYTFG